MTAVIRLCSGYQGHHRNPAGLTDQTDQLRHASCVKSGSSLYQKESKSFNSAAVHQLHTGGKSGFVSFTCWPVDSITTAVVTDMPANMGGVSYGNTLPVLRGKH